MNKLKNRRIPAVPRNLIWQELIEGTSQVPLAVCVERVENMQKRWHYPYVVYVYPLRVDADAAEFVITIKIGSGLTGWLFAELHAQTEEITSVQAEAGADSNIKALFVIVGFIGSLVAFIAFINNFLLGSLISLALYKLIKGLTRDFYARDPVRYGEKMQAGFGLWLDHNACNEPSLRPENCQSGFTPQSFEQAVDLALRYSDRYVWIYSQSVNWYTGEDIPSEWAATLAELGK